MPIVIDLPFKNHRGLFTEIRRPGGALSDQGVLSSGHDIALGRGHNVRSVALGIVVAFSEIVVDRPAASLPGARAG